MRTVVVFESMFGNTETLATAIGKDWRRTPMSTSSTWTRRPVTGTVSTCWWSAGRHTLWG